MVYHNSALLICKKTEYTKQHKVKQKKKGRNTSTSNCSVLLGS